MRQRTDDLGLKAYEVSQVTSLTPREQAQGVRYASLIGVYLFDFWNKYLLRRL